jgi:hypothetical protein
VASGLASLRRIVAFAELVIGPCDVVADLSWPHGESRVVELSTPTGARFVAKAHLRPAKFAAELTAYEKWVTSLGEHAPRLVGAGADDNVLIMTRIDGGPAGDATVGAAPASVDAHTTIDVTSMHRQAGALLARFHGAAPPVRLDGYAASQRERLATWCERAEPSVLRSDEIAFVAHALDVLDDRPDPLGVPCHRDWQPRNWLVDANGIVSAIDFEHARVSPWFEDLQRLSANEWAHHPPLADAFFEGYGHCLSGADEQRMRATAALGHLVTIVWAHEHRDHDYEARARDWLSRARRSDVN